MKTDIATKHSKEPVLTQPKQVLCAQCESKNDVPKLKKHGKNSTPNHHVADLIKKLKYFTEPDFSAGNDFWPRMDSRLNGQIHLIIQQAIAALDESHHGLKD